MTLLERLYSILVIVEKPSCSSRNYSDRNPSDMTYQALNKLEYIFERIAKEAKGSKTTVE